MPPSDELYSPDTKVRNFSKIFIQVFDSGEEYYLNSIAREIIP